MVQDEESQLHRFNFFAVSTSFVVQVCLLTQISVVMFYSDLSHSIIIYLSFGLYFIPMYLFCNEMRRVCNRVMPVITPFHVVRAFRYTWLLSVTGILWRRHSPNRISRSGSKPSRCGKYTVRQGFLLRFDHHVFSLRIPCFCICLFMQCSSMLPKNKSLPGKTSGPSRNNRVLGYVHTHLYIVRCCMGA